MIKNPTVVSLFDGIAGARVALDRLNNPPKRYVSSEIDPYSMSVSRTHYPDIEQVGDILKLDPNYLPQEPDLLVAGFRCQPFSRAGKELAFDDPRTATFFKALEIKDSIKPKHFLFENVRMGKQHRDRISELLGVEPIVINSVHFTAQNRVRYYWTDIPGVSQPTYTGVRLRDILEPNVFPVILHNLHGGFNEKTVRVYVDKSPTIVTAGGGGHIPSAVLTDFLTCPQLPKFLKDHSTQSPPFDFQFDSGLIYAELSKEIARFFKGMKYSDFKTWNVIRTLYPVECERLQGFNDFYTLVPIYGRSGRFMAKTRRFNMLGNSFTVQVIAHILSYVFS